MQTENLGDVELIAEIGGNHEGNFEYACQLNDLAIKSQADIVKYQLYTGGTIANSIVDNDRFNHFRKFELTKEQHSKLASDCVNAGKEYLASVWDIDFLNHMDPFLKRYKVGSGDLTNKLLIREFCRRKKPIILSTGLASFEEVKNCLKFIRSLDDFYKRQGSIYLMQCTSMYPIADNDSNLSVIPSYANFENIIPGYSDHTTGIDALFFSVTLGARILEFHFTDNRAGKTFRDHSVSLTNNEISELADKIKQFDIFYGNSSKKPLEIEISTDHTRTFRRGVYLNRDVKMGTVITETDLVALRPNVGISAWEVDQVIGRKCLVDISKLQPLNWNMFE
jgi:N,N'-diacetyllegionaminate synthase